MHFLTSSTWIVKLFSHTSPLEEMVKLNVSSIFAGQVLLIVNTKGEEEEVVS